MVQLDKSITIAGISFEISAQIETHFDTEFDLELDVSSVDNDTFILDCNIKTSTSQKYVLRNWSVKWEIPIVEMHGLYFGGNPRSEFTYLPFWHHNKRVSTHTGVPYLSLFHRNGNNQLSVGSFDQITETNMIAELSELTGCYHFTFQKPYTNSQSPSNLTLSNNWKEALFVSLSLQPWYEVLRSYIRLNDEQLTQPLMPVPEQAYDPVFCTWTAVHHDVSHDWIMKNAPIAAKLGFRTWLTDDGWFIEQGSFGNYRHAGEWHPNDEKFPDFKDHVNAVQALGFRYVLWVSPFMVGYDSSFVKQYPHLLNTGQPREQFYNFSPQNPEVKKIIVELLERLVKDYQLDGLKIDFIDSLSFDNGSKTHEISLGQSIYEILYAACTKLRELNPNILIEFRNSYANLVSRDYANIYRSSDVPFNFTMNLWQAVMLRLLAPDRAIHMDPAIWHPHDSDENVAVHLIHLIASVPMVSIDLTAYPQSHLDLIRYWIGFYNEHCNVIIKGNFKPKILGGTIPMIQFEGQDETIIGVYQTNLIPLPYNNTVWILNASTNSYVDIDTYDNRNMKIIVIHRNKFGEIITKEQIQFPVSRLFVEIGGSLEISIPNDIEEKNL